MSPRSKTKQTNKQTKPNKDDSLEEDTTFYSPPTLKKLVRERLLREEALAISSLKDLPNRMFPVTLEEAFIDGHTKLLTAMICVWPFTYLSVGMMIKNLSLDNLKAVLEVLKILFQNQFTLDRQDQRGLEEGSLRAENEQLGSENSWPNAEQRLLVINIFFTPECKLREINWRDPDHEMCGIWAGSHEGESLPEFMELNQPVQNSPDYGVKKELKVTTQLHLIEGSLDECATYMLYWAQQRKDYVHLCCRKLEIQWLPKATVIEIFKIIHADCIQNLELRCLCIEDLDFLNLYLKQMNNLLTLSLDEIKGTISVGYSKKHDEEKVITLTSQLPTFNHLQELCIDDVPFIQGNLKECLRCLKKHLETLSITNCKLTQSDLDYLPYCLNIFELKGLYLIEIPLRHLLLEPLGFLLERVRHTLEWLVLKSCGMGEFHFNVLLPGISQCSQLTEVNFYDNELSLLFLKKFLDHTDNLSQITPEVYPAPLECYDNEEVRVSQRLENFCPELLDILRAKRQPNSVTFATTPCSNCGGSFVYDLETKRCVFEKHLQYD